MHNMKKEAETIDGDIISTINAVKLRLEKKKEKLEAWEKNLKKTEKKLEAKETNMRKQMDSLNKELERAITEAKNL